MQLPIYTKYVIMQADLEMCLKKATSRSAYGNVYFPDHMRCLANGNFDPIQCVNKYTNEDQCFCMDKEFNVNGTMTFQSTITDLK